MPNLSCHLLKVSILKSRYCSCTKVRNLRGADDAQARTCKRWTRLDEVRVSKRSTSPPPYMIAYIVCCLYQEVWRAQKNRQNAEIRYTTQVYMRRLKRWERPRNLVLASICFVGILLYIQGTWYIFYKITKYASCEFDWIYSLLILDFASCVMCLVYIPLFLLNFQKLW